MYNKGGGRNVDGGDWKERRKKSSLDIFLSFVCHLYFFFTSGGLNTQKKKEEEEGSIPFL